MAIKIKDGVLPRDVFEYTLEPENKEKIMKLLPLHCQFGKIVAVEEIFDIVQVSSASGFVQISPTQDAQ